MKTSVITIAALLLTISGPAQTVQNTANHKAPTSHDTDLKTSLNDTTQSQSVAELFFIGEKSYRKDRSGYDSVFKGHWRGFHFGFTNFANLPTEWNDLHLEGGGSYAMQFNLFTRDIALNRSHTLGLTTGLGLEYQRFRFSDENITLTKDGSNNIPRPVNELYTEIIPKNIKRSSFKNLYLTIPFMIEQQFPARLSSKRRAYVAAGVMGGVRMHSKTKVVYTNDDDKKQKAKEKGNFNMVPFKVDAVARIGYNWFNIWGSYTLTNTFKASNMPDFHVYTLGFGFVL